MLLEVDNVSKNFGGVRALNNVSFNLEPGMILGLIGPNGAGKSTLFNIITGTLPPTSGTIYLDGRNITGMPVHKIAGYRVARTFQMVRPFMNLSVKENVVIGAMFAGRMDRQSAEKAASEALESVGLADKQDLFAHQLNVMSRKWLEVARALATRPRLLLLDEFMAGLNPSEVQQAVEFVRGLRQSEITVVIVEHIIKAIMNCSDRIIVLNAGQKIADAPPDEIVKDPNVISAYLGNDYAAN
ncbi:MAG TPA: ABC transporter ATP-binding protein [Oceanobacillus sp.]|nr:ABC transporter ATP-binding protein [Oceanobacillus sp.]